MNEKRLINANDALRELDRIEKIITKEIDKLNYENSEFYSLASRFYMIRTCKNVINNTPTAEERRMGRWESLDNCSNAGVYCSECSKKVYPIEYAKNRIKMPYCPNCGSYNGHTVITEEMRIPKAICGTTKLPCIYCNGGCEYRKEGIK